MSEINRSSPPEVFLGKGVLKISIKLTGEHSCRSANSVNLENTLTPHPSMLALKTKIMGQ